MSRTSLAWCGFFALLSVASMRGQESAAAASPALPASELTQPPAPPAMQEPVAGAPPIAPAASPQSFQPPSTPGGPPSTGPSSSVPVPASRPAPPLLPPAPLNATSQAAAPASLTVPSPSSFAVYPDYREANVIAQQLRAAQPRLYNFDRASLRDILRYLADDAGIPFIGIQDAGSAETTLVTFTMRASPFQALEAVARANGVALFYDNGVWYMRPLNENELIGRTYNLRFNTQEKVTYGGGGDSGVSQTGTGGSTAGSSGEGGGGGTGGAPTGATIDLQGGSTVFEVQAPKIVDEIKGLLGIPTSGIEGRVATDGSVGNFGSLPPTGSLSVGGRTLSGSAAPAAGSGAQVLYNSDNNTIYIVATRQQHQWVEGFLAAVDRPQALIGIEVKFFETTKDPSKELGINWSGTLGAGGFTVAARDMVASPSGTVNGSVLNGTASISANPTPYSAVLTASDVAVTLQAFARDRDTSTVQYPRVLTINNREVVIRSVINQPVLASTSTVTPGVGGTTTASVSYLPIGTIINVLPKTMSGESVVLNVAITVSSIVGEQSIEGNAYPIASSRIYNAALQVNSGYTLVVGGLEEAFDRRDRQGIPYLQDMPGLGELFKSRQRQRTKRNLIVFITPTIMKDHKRTPGISQDPQTVLPIRPGDPTPPVFTPDGRLSGGVEALPGALKWLARQVEIFRQINRENRTDRKSIDQISGVLATAAALQAQIPAMRSQRPSASVQIDRDAIRLQGIIEDLEAVLAASRKNLM